MILDALDEVLFWDDIPLLHDFTQSIVEKYYPHDSQSYFQEKDRFLAENIPTKAAFLERLENYVINGSPTWVSGRNQLSEDISADDLQKAIRLSQNPQNGKEKADMATALIEKNPAFWNFYTDNILHAPHNQICELTVGAGLGTTAVMRGMKDNDFYMGVDIDFICAKNADSLAKHFKTNGLGIATSLWNMPFEDEMFTSVCCNQGLEECREIPTILKEASRILAPSGRFVVRCQKQKKPAYFENYGFSADETRHHLRRLRLYSDFEQIREIACQNYLELVDSLSDNGNWYILVFRKQ